MRMCLLSILILTPGLLAQNGATCHEVGGGIVTNFTSQTATLGTATGDLKGGLGVQVLSVAPGPNGTLVFHNQHQWVTASGDVLSLAGADATAYPIAEVPGLFAVRYNNGAQIMGGTGRFDGASGTLAVFGALDQNQGQIVLRYSGQVCLKPVTTNGSRGSGNLR